MATPIGIGIDIAKDTLDVACSDSRWHQTFPMTPQGLQALAD